jgi:LysM repeat protein
MTAALIHPSIRRSIDQSIAHRPRPSAATYRRRRAVVGITSAAVVAVGLVATHDVLAGSGGDPASAAVSQPAHATLIAQPGDNLWSIAAEHHGEVSITRYLDTLVDINGGATIQVGQQIVLP